MSQLGSATNALNSKLDQLRGLAEDVKQMGQTLDPSLTANVNRIAAQSSTLANQGANLANRLLAIDPNKLNHIFGKAQHNLGPFVSKCNGIADAYLKIQDAVNAAVVQNRITGVFQIVVNVAGEQITVRGNVVNGVVQIGTAFK